MYHDGEPVFKCGVQYYDREPVFICGFSIMTGNQCSNVGFSL